MAQLYGQIQAVWRAVAMALLLVVTAHAAAPPAEAMSRTTGSAFNSATADVTLRVRGNPIVVHAPSGIEPPLPLVASTALSSSRVAVPDARRRDHRAPRAPPAAETTFLPLSPRAPPAV